MNNGYRKGEISDWIEEMMFARNMIIILAAILILFLCAFVVAAYADTEKDCVRYSSNHMIHLTTSNIGGCNWLVDKLQYNGSGFTEVQYDREVYIQAMWGSELRYTIDATNIETWILTKK